MSSDFSEPDVENAVSDNSQTEDSPKTVEQVFSQGRMIYGAIQGLHEKMDYIKGRLAQRHCCHAEAMLPTHDTQTNTNLSENQEEIIYPADLDRPQSYSPTSPVRRRDYSPTSPVRRGDYSPTSPVRRGDYSPTSPVRRGDYSPTSPVRRGDYSPTSPVRRGDYSPTSPVRRGDYSPTSPVRRGDYSPTSPARRHAYSPTSPVRRRDSVFQINYDAASLTSDMRDDTEPPLYDDYEEVYTQSTGGGCHSVLPANALHSHYTPDDDKAGPSLTLCFCSPRVPGSCLYSPTQPVAGASPNYNSGMYYPNTLADQNNTPRSLCVHSRLELGNSPVFGHRQMYLKDPSAWSVEEVIQFLRRNDPQIPLSVIDILRQHDVDGKALLLLRSDKMMSYFGLKMGAAVKLAYYIKKLRQSSHFKP